jgi:tRNA modification GTPase
MLDNYQDTIIAQCTPNGSGAIALLRLCGKNVFSLVDRFAKLPSQQKIISLATHTIHYGDVVDNDNKILDHVLFLIMHGPKTFTGQDTVEITCHNNPFIIQALIDHAILCGARMAQHGEFTKRAVLNNKLNLLQAESINDLIHANNQQALKTSLSQVSGSLSSWITEIEHTLTLCLALSESSFEFIDEEYLTFADQINDHIVVINKKIKQLQQYENSQQQIRDGISIALIGSVNAGKSSLFNALIGKDRAIVTNIAGTTRDAIHAGLYAYESYITFIDTAGLRKTNDVIEQHGIARSHEYAQKADIVLLVIDGSRTLTNDEEIVCHELEQKYTQKIIIVKTKNDLPQQIILPSWVQKYYTCSVNDENSIQQITNKIKERIDKFLNDSTVPFLLNQRQSTLLKTLEQKITLLLPMLHGNIQYEIVSYHLNDALATLSELTGKTISENAMDKIFKEFCIGK